MGKGSWAIGIGAALKYESTSSCRHHFVTRSSTTGPSKSSSSVWGKSRYEHMLEKVSPPTSVSGAEAGTSAKRIVTALIHR